MAANYQAAVNEMVSGLGHLLRASVAGAGAFFDATRSPRLYILPC